MSRRLAAFTDGLSNTLLSAEVKTYTQAYHDCGAVPPRTGQPVRVSRRPPPILAAIASAPASGCRIAGGFPAAGIPIGATATPFMTA